MSKVSPYYDDWRKNPSKKNMSNVLKDYDRLIKSEAIKYQGTLPTPTLFAKAKGISIDAVRTYNPNKGTALSTHIVGNLKRLNRVNYEASRSVRLPEDLQRGVGGYLSAKTELEARYGREPTAAEMADELNWPISRVSRLARNLRGESTTAEVEFDPGVITPEYENEMMDYVYHDLNKRDQTIFEHVTGYGGQKVLKKKDIAKKLKVSPAIISQRSVYLAKKLREGLNL